MIKKREVKHVATVFEVAKYILEKKEKMSTMKLQKLLYYCQAWSLVWEDGPLFPNTIQAWANGPVIPDLFELHKGRYCIDTKFFKTADTDNLTPEEKGTIGGVVEYYGDKSPQWLSDLTHSETPWIEARRGIPDGQRGAAEITLESMAMYYSSL